nr:NADH-quinone oxidoreductase subunit NuoE [Beggiatoa leptomitoformis]
MAEQTVSTYPLQYISKPHKGMADKHLSADLKAQIDRWIAKYPSDWKRSAVMPSLTIVQEANGGWLTTELMDAVADYLEMEPIAVYEVATFYSMYEHKPVGRYKICVCTNVSCMLCGSDEIVEHLQQKLGVGFGEVTTDGKFSLKEVECLAACGGAPMMQIGNKYYENLTPTQVDEILASLE